MRKHFRITYHGDSMQDDRAEITFSWDKDEMRELPSAVRAAIEAVVQVTSQHLFEPEVTYLCSRDEDDGRLSLHPSDDAPEGGSSLSAALKAAWNDILEVVNNDLDSIKCQPDCSGDYGSRRYFLRQLELVDALLRFDLRRAPYWNIRKKWTCKEFMAELRD